MQRRISKCALVHLMLIIAANIFCQKQQALQLRWETEKQFVRQNERSGVQAGFSGARETIFMENEEDCQHLQKLSLLEVMMEP